MVNGIFQQRLKQQRWYECVDWLVVQIPIHIEAISKTQPLHIKIAGAQVDFIIERHQLFLLLHQHAEHVGDFLEHAFGAFRILANDPQHTVQTVEEEMRPYPGGQGVQACLGQGGRVQASAVIEIGEDDETADERPSVPAP